MLKQLEQEVIEELEKHLSKHVFLKQMAQTVQTMKQILDYIAKNADLFKVLLSENGDSSFQRAIMLLAQQKTISDLRNGQKIDARISEYLQSFVITGTLSIVQKWLQGGMVESTQKMAELTSKLFFQGLSDFYS